jgi:hypothetical protein
MQFPWAVGVTSALALHLFTVSRHADSFHGSRFVRVLHENRSNEGRRVIRDISLVSHLPC